MSKKATPEPHPVIPETIPADITFADFYEIYLHDMEVRLKPASLSSKQHIFAEKILPFFGPLPMKSITTQHVRKWQSVILRQNYSSAHQQLIDSQLSAMMNYAQRYYDFQNPCKKAGHIGGVKSKKLNFWTPEEYTRFISCSSTPDSRHWTSQSASATNPCPPRWMCTRTSFPTSSRCSSTGWRSCTTIRMPANLLT